MGKILIIRVKEKGAFGDRCYEYKNDINIHDAKQIALILQDLGDLYNAPIEKAFAILKETKGENIFPFSPS
jgi:hypothetical protein